MVHIFFLYDSFVLFTIILWILVVVLKIKTGIREWFLPVGRIHFEIILKILRNREIAYRDICYFFFFFLSSQKSSLQCFSNVLFPIYKYRIRINTLRFEHIFNFIIVERRARLEMLAVGFQLPDTREGRRNRGQNPHREKKRKSTRRVRGNIQNPVQSNSPRRPFLNRRYFFSNQMTARAHNSIRPILFEIHIIFNIWKI